MKLTKEQILAYHLGHNTMVKWRLKDDSDFRVSGHFDEPEGKCTLSGDMVDWSHEFKILKPLLRPLSSLTKPITVEGHNNGKPFIPIDYFEVTDDHITCPIEQDHGNVKLIALLKSISKNNVLFDVQFLPLWVIDLLLSWQFNLFLQPGEFVEIED